MNFNLHCTYLSPLWSILFSDGDVILVELPVLTTGLDLDGDLVKLVTLFSVDLVRVGVVVALWVDSASFFLCNYLHVNSKSQLYTFGPTWRSIKSNSWKSWRYNRFRRVISSSGGNCFRTSLGLTLYTNTRILSETFRTASAGWCRPEEPNSDNVRQVSPLQQLQYLIRVIAF